MIRAPLLASTLAGLVAVTAAACLGGTPAHADRAAADSCAARLDANGKMVYSATLPTLQPGANLRDALTSSARSLVMSGKLDRSVARGAAEAAAPCLELALS